MLGVELPSQEASQAPAPQCTTAPSQGVAFGPQWIEQEPSPQLKSRSPQPSFTSHTSVHAYQAGQLTVPVSHASRPLHTTTQA